MAHNYIITRFNGTEKKLYHLKKDGTFCHTLKKDNNVIFQESEIQITKYPSISHGTASFSIVELNNDNPVDKVYLGCCRLKMIFDNPDIGYKVASAQQQYILLDENTSIYSKTWDITHQDDDIHLASSTKSFSPYTEDWLNINFSTISNCNVYYRSRETNGNWWRLTTSTIMKAQKSIDTIQIYAEPFAYHDPAVLPDGTVIGTSLYNATTLGPFTQNTTYTAIASKYTFTVSIPQSQQENCTVSLHDGVFGDKITLTITPYANYELDGCTSPTYLYLNKSDFTLDLVNKTAVCNYTYKAKKITYSVTLRAVDAVTVYYKTNSMSSYSSLYQNAILISDLWQNNDYLYYYAVPYTHYYVSPTDTPTSSPGKQITSGTSIWIYGCQKTYNLTYTLSNGTVKFYSDSSYTNQITTAAYNQTVYYGLTPNTGYLYNGSSATQYGTCNWSSANYTETTNTVRWYFGSCDIDTTVCWSGTVAWQDGYTGSYTFATSGSSFDTSDTITLYGTYKYAHPTTGGIKTADLYASITSSTTMIIKKSSTATAIGAQLATWIQARISGKNTITITWITPVQDGDAVWSLKLTEIVKHNT